jgi:hypothetical protein
MRTAQGNDIITVHLCSHPEITVSGDEATGSWCLEDTVVVPQHRVVIRGAAYYEDRYRREPEGWRIAHTGYERIYETTAPWEPGLRLTTSMWATPVA